MTVFSGSQNIAELLKMVMTSRSRCDATNVATSDNAGVLSLAFNKYSQAVVKETYTGVRRLTPETGFGVKVRSGYAPISELFKLGVGVAWSKHAGRFRNAHRH